MRVPLRILIALVVVALIVQTWLVLGVVAPVVVSGGSMAPGLVGEHYHVVCQVCARPFACGQESTPPDHRALCPSCGAWCDLESADLRPGDRLFVDRTAFFHSAPNRWSRVVCPLPDSAGALGVKRVVGLPGERITISDGDLYANGEILRKDWDVLSTMAIVVDSAEYQPHSDAAVSRWRADREDSRWRGTEKGFEIDKAPPAADGAGAIDWLTYHHEQIWRQGESVARRGGPILDDLAYNQNESRELVAVPDVMLVCRLESAGDGQVYLRASDGRKEFVVRLDMAGRRGEVREGDRALAHFVLPTSMSLEQPHNVGLALADCRLQLVVAGVPIVDYRYDPADSASRQPTAEPFGVGAVGMPLRFTEWVVSRDIYYLPAPGEVTTESRQLGPNEYWLLGDNTAVSDDSRTWPPEVRMTRDVLVGGILRWR
ncbi:MAG TPA: S26 family signal peptidase [Pirellulales bacterium]|jgi:signal peptidase I|nr:S26 family signal peptidase [Pirellulales bacterium]